jgi:hypothetical protein
MRGADGLVKGSVGFGEDWEAAEVSIDIHNILIQDEKASISNPLISMTPVRRERFLAA